MRRWLLFDRARHNVLFLAALMGLPFLLEFGLGRTVLLATEILIFALVGLGFNVLLGYTGLLSFGHGMFLGCGSYAASLFQIHFFRDSFVLPILFGMLAATLVGVLVGYLVMRKRGVYFALLTLAFTQLFFYVCFRWTALTGGENGLPGIERPERFFGIDLNNDYTFYYFTLLVVIISIVLIRRMLKAPFGRVLQAVRDNELRAACVGYDTKRYKHIAVAVSALFCGVAGALHAFLLYFSFPEIFHVLFSGNIVAMTVVGGMRHFFGPVVGGAVFVLLQDLLSSITKNWMIFFGMIFMAFILFSPNGIMGIIESLRNALKRSASGAPGALEGHESWMEIGPETPDPAASEIPNPAPSDEEVLVLRGVTKRFGGLAAVNEVSLSLKKGQLHAIIGPNGAGKTTLFNVLTGVLPIDAGRVIFKGGDITGDPPHRIARQGVARSFQITSIFKDLTVFENVRVAVQSTTRHRMSFLVDTECLGDINQQTERILKLVGLSPLRGQVASSVSHGDQRLLEIGISLATNPELLVLDEPLAGLSAQERVRIAGLVRALAGSHTIVLIDHDIDQVMAISDRITVLHQGEVIAEGQAEEVRSNPLVQEAYIGGSRVAGSLATEPVSHEQPAMLELSEINSFYGKSRILQDLSIRIFPGELVCLLGRNGAGKTTTLHSIMGQVQPRTGDVRFMGRSIARRSPEAICRMGIQLVPQGRRIFPNLSVTENLQIAYLSAKKADRRVTWTPERAFDLFPQLENLKQSRGENLSGGELQMLSIARALMGNGQLLMLDEPFEGLAPAIVEDLWRIIDELKRETTILLVEQNAEVALSLGHRAYVINNGIIAWEGKAAELQRNEDLRVSLLGV